MTMSLVTNYDDQIAHIVRESEEMCDVYEDKLGSYMVKLSQTQMSSSDSRKVSTILHCLSDFVTGYLTLTYYVCRIIVEFAKQRDFTHNDLRRRHSPKPCLLRLCLSMRQCF